MLSNLHLGAVDPDGGPPIMVGKTFKGLTDKLLDWQTGQFLEREVRRRRNRRLRRAEHGHRDRRRRSAVVYKVQRLVWCCDLLGSRRYQSDKSTAEADTIETVRALLSPVSE